MKWLVTLIFVLLAPIHAFCFPEGGWVGTGTSVLDDGKARTCEKITLEIQLSNEGKYYFVSSARCEGTYSVTPSFLLSTQEDSVLFNGKVVGSFKDQTMILLLPLDLGYGFEFRLKFDGRTVDFDQKLVADGQYVQRHYKGSLKQ